MTTTVQFRWLLALLALLTPAAVLHRTAERPAGASAGTARPSSSAETVFRHYV